MGLSHSSHSQYREHQLNKNKYPKGYHRNARSVSIPRITLDPHDKR